MKKNLLIIFSCLLFLAVIVGISSFVAPREDHFYYAFNEKVPLRKQENKIAIRFKSKDNAKRLSTLFNAAGTGLETKWEDDRTIVVSTRSEDDLINLKTKIKEQSDVQSANPVYSLLETGLEMIVTDEILIQFKSSVSKETIDSINTSYALKLLKQTEIYWLYQVQKDKDALQIANTYQKSGLVVYAQPNFLSKIQFHQSSVPNDPYFTNQWNLNNTGQLFNGHSGTPNADINAPEAWARTTGCNSVVVAVLDQGVTSNHIDLPNSRQLRLPGSNFGDGDPNNPSPTSNDNHGNSCAGLIAATRNNNIGIAGIAPEVRIMPIRIFNFGGGSITTQALADAITFAKNNGADVISNSWGFNSNNQNLHPVIVTAIQDAVTTGRNGKGCVVVFAAGNTANLAAGNNGFVGFPAGVNIAGVLTVGATDRQDRQANYSPTSSLIDITAPSHRAYPTQITGETFEVWSIDIPGNAGYNPWPDPNTNPPAFGEILPNTGTNNLDFTGRFGGTSAACPQVSAVAALMLSMNPDLTQQQVFSHLINSADKVGGYSYANGRNDQVGFGRLNAFQAIVISTNGVIAGPDIFCSNITQFQINNLPAGSSIQWSVSGPILINGSNSVNPVSINANGSGTATLTATISNISGCGAKVFTKTINVGPPPFIGPISGPMSLCPNAAGYYTVTYIPGATYNWVYGNGLTYNSGGYGPNIFLSTSSTFNGGYIQVSASNSCGSSATVVLSVQRSYSGCYGYYTYSVSPNPSTDNITIKATKEQNFNTTTTPSGTKVDTATKKPKVEVKLYYFTDGSLAKTYLVDKEDYVINTLNMKRGKYVMHIIEDGEIQVVEQLVFE